MRKLFLLGLLLIIIIALILPRAGRAQDEILLSELEVWLWPEYDSRYMLIIYQGTLQPEVTSADLTFRIPLAAGKPSRVLVWGDDGNQYKMDYHYVKGSEYGEVTFHASTPHFQLEYYDPGLVYQGANRQFVYTWTGDYAVISASIVVQQPSDASQMQFTPVVQQPSDASQMQFTPVVQQPSNAGQMQFTPQNVTNFIGADNLLYHKLQIGTLQKDQTFDFTLSYKKSSDALTYDKQHIRVAGGDLPQSMWDRGLPWAVGVLALLIIAAGLLFYWRAGMPQAEEKNHKPGNAVFPADSEVVADDSGVYCHNCGRRGALNDLFCRSCGTKLRI